MARLFLMQHEDLNDYSHKMPKPKHADMVKLMKARTKDVLGAEEFVNQCEGTLPDYFFIRADKIKK